MTDRILGLANDVVRLSTERLAIESKVLEARHAVVQEIKAIAKAAGMDIEELPGPWLGLKWRDS